MSKGIYKITNKLNNKSYIGLSVDVERRWRDHINNHTNKNSKEYEKLLYRAMRKYGVENFEFSILEELEDGLEERETFWIEKTDSYRTGYNETIGGEIGNQQSHETHSRTRLTNEEVIDIRERYNNKERRMVVYEDYKDKIGWSGFIKIWTGETWKGLHDHVYTKENKEFHLTNSSMVGEKNGRARLTEDDVIDIRTRKKNGEKRRSVYLDYQDRVTFGSFTNTWYGYNWKHIKV